MKHLQLFHMILDLLNGHNHLIEVKKDHIIYIIDYNFPNLEFIYEGKLIKTSSFLSSQESICLEELF